MEINNLNGLYSNRNMDFFGGGDKISIKPVKSNQENRRSSNKEMENSNVSGLIKKNRFLEKENKELKQELTKLKKLLNK